MTKGNIKAKPILIVSGIIVAVFLVIFLGLFAVRASSDPEDTVITFSEYFNSGEYRKMLYYVDPSEAKLIRKALKYVPDELTDSTLEILLPFLSDATNVKLYPDIVDVQEEKKRAVVTVKFRKLDEENLYDVYLFKKHGFWYVKYVWKADEQGDNQSS